VKKTEDLIVKEHVNRGIAFVDYWNLFKFSTGSGAFSVFIVIVLTVLHLGLLMYIGYFMSLWASVPFEEQQTYYYPNMFTLLVLGFLFNSTLRNFFTAWCIISNSTNTHKLMVEAVTRS
jgi:hypothetical protein